MHRGLAVGLAGRAASPSSGPAGQGCLAASFNRCERSGETGERVKRAGAIGVRWGQLVARQAAATGEPPHFLFVTCQVGAEPALKSEFGRLWPSFQFAYSRPGFITFKLPEGHLLGDDFDPRSVFARACGFSLGKVNDAEISQRAAAVWHMAGDLPFEALHVWQRDTAPVGYRGFEAHVTEAVREAEAAIRAAAPSTDEPAPALPVSAAPGQLVLDCVLVEPGEWWVGYHRARAGASCTAGGLSEIALPHDAVSRAYLKMEEALAWSDLPIEAGQQFVEIGCAPGGASQALLARGLKVLGVDPATVDPCVLANANFTHIRKRGADVRRREYRHATWLSADMNVAPTYTLDTVESIVTHPMTNIRGLLLTLKLLDWKLADELPAYLARIRGWGYGRVAARQLAHNRQEVCVTALRKPKGQRAKAARVE